MDRKTKKIYRITGSFIVAAFMLLVLAILFIALRQNLLTKRVSYYTIVDNAVGLSKSTSVVFKGYEIGRVRSYRFNKDNNIEVDLFVYDNFSHIIVDGSVFEKNVHPLTGRGTLDFIKGEYSDKVLEEGTYIYSTDFEVGRKLLAMTKDRIRGEPISSLINKLEQFVDNLNRDDNYDEGAFFRLVYHFGYLAENMNRNMENLNHLLVALGKDGNQDDGVIFRLLVNAADLAEEAKITNSLMVSNMVKLNTLIENYQQPDGLVSRMVDPTGMELIQPMSETLLLLQKNLQKVNEIVDFVNNHTPEMLLLISEGNRTLNQLQKTLEGLNNNPLIRGGITEPERPLPGQRMRSIGEQE